MDPGYHLMELPTKILIGDGVIGKLGGFVTDKGPRKTVISSGSHVTSKVRATVDGTLDKRPVWVEVTAADTQNVDKVTRAAKGAGRIIGVGGGKSVDVGKLAAFQLGVPFYSVPTSASHDGISSPFASLRGLDRPYSVKAKPPVGILADTEVIGSAPKRLLASGCGDLVSKLTAVKDWQLAHKATGEYYGGYSASLALMSADVVLNGSKAMGRFGKASVRDLVEALISTGVAAGIAGSSRPCSGSEHLFSHYLDVLEPGVGLHGEKCGIGTIMMARLHGLDWRRVREALLNVGAPVEASAIGIGDSPVVQSLAKASTIRPDRYTILSERRLDERSAKALARATGVI
ncbi:MAG: iron-containing alcohol dehydrogenase [Nitrososphaerota archaeon]|jgi:glycerol-1-phosphate dehydrogenase [NAD(P)+]|nr:iron-containing alcohol dehydrogenase [Nitrososphaerota archaeon]MDG6947324.1 iron-containing alcohol dehydrogenase [Nitrososphaerota archaeon]